MATSLTSLNQLLHLLADGEFHSGTELGECLSISRTAIWKQLQELAGLGLTLHRVRGRGYRLPGGLDLLDCEAIQRQLKVTVVKHLQALQVVMSTTSTNQKLQQHEQYSVHGRVLLAELQTAGRGRRGRSWQSPFAKSISLSLGWSFAGGIAALEGLSLVVGLAVLTALEQVGLVDAGLKWPNDILVRGRKLAGILLEIRGDAEGPCQVVIGIGLNVAQTEADDQTISQPWISLHQLGIPVSRNTIAASIINQLVAHLLGFEKTGFAQFQDHWQACHCYQDQTVSLHLLEQVITGICRGVDSSGALLLQQGLKMHTFSGGEVSVRLDNTKVLV
jgi:BirA family biotin operon repressor/biotin-[acetyl-CoA-carboxylase] ligase